MLTFLLFALFAAWLCFTFGFALVGTAFAPAQRLVKILWNGRIDKLQKPPFSWFLQHYAQKHYWRSFLFVVVCNLPGHIMMFLFGFVKIGLVMVLVQPFLQGAVVGMGDDKTRLYGVATAAVEVTGFVVSCVLGFFGAWHLWWISAIFLVLNGLVEASGVLLGAQGVPGAEAVQNKQYK